MVERLIDHAKTAHPQQSDDLEFRQTSAYMQGVDVVDTVAIEAKTGNVGHRCSKAMRHLQACGIRRSVTEPMPKPVLSQVEIDANRRFCAVCMASASG